MFKRYRYSYQTIVRYDSMVSHHHFLLRCTPISRGYQSVVESGLQLLNSASVTQGEDMFGSQIHYGSIMQRHDLFVVLSSGTVRCREYCEVEDVPKRYYAAQSAMTRLEEDSFVQWSESISVQGTSLEQAIALAGVVYDYMEYTPFVTTTLTTAVQSFELRAGVCQDYAHILIALCRRRGILARYIVGLVEGTGETHAWVEVYSEGVWYGVDPTHNRFVEWGYIKLSHGRDAMDCSVTRGVHCGAFGHTTEVKVTVEELF